MMGHTRREHAGFVTFKDTHTYNAREGMVHGVLLARRGRPAQLVLKLMDLQYP